MEHSKTPWKIGTPPPNGEQTIGTIDGLMVAVTTTGYGLSSEANARRIVACVNACAGIPQDDVEELAEFGVMELTVYADDMRQQRDHLQSQLEAERASMFAENQRKQQLEQQVQELVGVLQAMLEEVAGCYCTTEAAARAVIQKVRGGE